MLPARTANSPTCDVAVIMVLREPNPGIRCGLAIPAQNATPRRPVVPTVERPGARRSPIDPTRTPGSVGATFVAITVVCAWFSGLVHVRGADLFRGVSFPLY